MKKCIILFILLLLFNPYPYIFTLKKNSNIDKAKQLIKEKRYKEAKALLAIELINNPKEEDVIIKLIDQIENFERKNYKNIKNAVKSIEEGSILTAKDFFDKIDDSEDYGERLNNTIEISKKINETIITNNNFINFISKAEKNLLEFDLTNALKNYINALDIYRIKKEELSDKKFEDLVKRIHNIEKKIGNSGIDIMYVNYSSEMDFNFLNNQFKKMKEKINEWFKIEEELLFIEKDLKNVDDETKEYIEFHAYSSITEKFIFLIRRSIQKYAFDLYNNILKYSNELSKKGMDELELIYNEFLNIYNGLLLNIDYYMFYKIIIAVEVDFYISRSKNNIVRYLDFITYKNNYLTTIYYIYVRSSYLKVDKNLKDYKKSLQDSDIDLAEKLLNKAKEDFNEIITRKREYDNVIQLFSASDYTQLKEYSKSIERYKAISDDIQNINKDIQLAFNTISNIKFTTNRYRNQADKFFDDAIKFFNNREYDKAMTNFKESKDLYITILTKNKTKEIYDRLDRIDKYLKEIDDILYYRDIQLADDYYTKAKTSFYKEEYENAKNLIEKAYELYKKYNEESPMITELKERINSAIKLKFDTVLSIDDPVYPYIMELYTKALNSYNNKQYDTAKDLVTQILLEKPYYEDAKRLEAMIFKAKNDRIGFIEIYKKYKEQALDKYRSGLYTESLRELKQLLIFEEDIKEIQNYINECLKKLRFVKTEEISIEEKNSAISMVKNAEKFYAEKKFDRALIEINNALKLWDEVPGGKDLRYRILLIVKGTREEQKLSRENEIRYKKAEEAYKNRDYDTTIALTDFILKSQDSLDVRKLNELAKRRKEQENQ